MRASVKFKIFTAMLIAAFMLLSSFSTAHADTKDWVLPWSEQTHTMSLNSAMIEHSNVDRSVSKIDVRSGDMLYNGYWHSMLIVFQSMGPDYLQLIAPAGGIVRESSKWHLDVETNDGDVYELQIYGSDSIMYEFSPGDTILTGDKVGELYLLKQHPTLGFEYLVASEPSYLFGVSRWSFADGTDLKDLAVNLYAGPPLPDLVADPIRVDGLESPNYNRVNSAVVYEPKSLILFDTGVTNSGTVDPQQAFNIKWYINGYQVGYGQHSIVTAGMNMTEDNSYLWWSFDPGTYYIQFQVDCDHFIPETDYTNNISGVYIVVGY